MAIAGLRKAKGSFFDKAKVIAAIGKANAKALSKSGNTLKLIAQRSMRYADPFRKHGKPRLVSKPGEPPRAVRTHPLLRKFLFAVYDFTTKNAIIGPIRLGLPGKTPSVLEHGGPVHIINKRRSTRVLGRSGEIRVGLGGRKTKMTPNTLLGTVPVNYSILWTPEQVSRSNRLNEQLYGPTATNRVIQPRPYMKPALVKTAEKMVDLWRSSVKA